MPLSPLQTLAAPPFARVWQTLNVVLTAALLLVWVIGIAMLLRGRRLYHALGEIEVAPGEADALPPLSILVPACNEAETVERAMRSLLALDYPRLEIIAIDDRSTDATGAILDRLAQTDPRLRVLHITELPSGWLGKNHALQTGGEQATGDWLLFTDADVVFAPSALKRALAHAVRAGVDHLIVSPRCETHGFWEKLFVSYFGLMFSFRVRPWEVANPKSPAYAGFGAFNLVRAEAYRSIGGHHALAMEVVDDMKLGKALKRRGFRAELLEGGDMVSVRWVVGLRGVLTGLDKNAFAGFDFKLPVMLTSVFGLLLTGLYPVAALFLPPASGRLLALLTLLAMAWGAGAVRRLSQAPFWYGLAYPLAALMLAYIILRSTWRAYRQQGILWRGTLYPLDELRKGVV